MAPVAATRADRCSIVARGVGMGQAHRARDLRLGRDIAVSLLIVMLGIAAFAPDAQADERRAVSAKSGWGTLFVTVAGCECTQFALVDRFGRADTLYAYPDPFDMFCGDDPNPAVRPADQIRLIGQFVIFDPDHGPWELRAVQPRWCHCECNSGISVTLNRDSTDMRPTEGKYFNLPLCPAFPPLETDARHCGGYGAFGTHRAEPAVRTPTKVAALDVGL
jgi:hypothetical protein